MSKTVVCENPDQLLRCEPGPSDRLCFSRQFVLRELKHIPMARQPEIDRVLDGIQKALDPAFGGAAVGQKTAQKKQVGRLQALAFQLRRRRAAPKEWQEVVDLLRTPEVRALTNAHAAAPVAAKPAGSGWSSADDKADASSGLVDAQRLLNLLRSEFGYLFYDRTRIRPANLRIGEHLYSLSLAPGEEVTIEQKSWTKRDVSLEELTEFERTLDLEFASTFTTEILDSLDEVKKIDVGLDGTAKGSLDPVGVLTAAVGLASGTPAASSGGGGGPIAVNGGIEPSIDLSDTVTQKEAATKTYQQTGKLAAKYRSMHKTTFKVTQEIGAENTSRRTIRNANRATPINLHYFKMLREHEITHERYGVRLCWAPWIRDPGTQVREGAQNAAKPSAGSLPARPAAPEMRASKPSEWSFATDIPAYAFDDTGGLGIESHRPHGVTLLSPKMCYVPDGWQWDEKQENVQLRLNFPGQRDHSIEKVGAAVLRRNVGPLSQPSEPGWFVEQEYRVGIACTRGTVAGKLCHEMNVTNKAWNNTPPGRVAQRPVCDHMNCTTDEPGYQYDVSVQMQIGLVPVLTPDERAAWDEYEKKLAIWEQLNQAQLATADGDAAAEAQAAAAPADFSPFSELMRRVVDLYFLPEQRDDYWEIEFWHRVFDWGEAGYSLYPGWWTGQPLPYPQCPDTHFLNASWARLFVPIRPGYERLAMQFILTYDLNLPENAATLAEIESIVKELEEYRLHTFGDAHGALVPVEGSDALTARFKVMGRWTEVLPTDGTHLEIIQSATSAAEALP